MISVLIPKFLGGSICSSSRARVAISSTRRISGLASRASFTVWVASIIFSIVVSHLPLLRSVTPFIQFDAVNRQLVRTYTSEQF